MLKTKLSWIFLLLWLCVCFVGILGTRGGHQGSHWDHDKDHYDRDHYDKDHHHDHDHDHDDDDDDEHKKPFWEAVGGVVVLFVVGIVACGLFSLIAWISCMCYKKVNRVKVVDPNVIRMGSRGSDAPFWSALLYYKKDIAGTGIGDFSKGMTLVSANQLVRSRPGTAETDGARWSAGMLIGKHVFEITWPWGHRGTKATVGVGTIDAALEKRGAHALVGGCCNTWGLDVVRRQVLHKGRVLATCPTDGSYVPDKFLMYVDMDNGTVGFGNDVTYWGQVITGLPTKASTPLYVMVGTCQYDAQITVAYKGSEGGDFATIASSYALPPVPGPGAPQQPPPYQEKTREGSRPSSAKSQVINVDEYQAAREGYPGREQPPPYCSPPPGYDPNA